MSHPVYSNKECTLLPYQHGFIVSHRSPVTNLAKLLFFFNFTSRLMFACIWFELCNCKLRKGIRKINIAR